MKIRICLLLCSIILSVVSADKCLTENDLEEIDKSSKSNLYKGEMGFTLKLLDVINKAMPNESVFFSSYSIFHALLLAYFASNGQTEMVLKNGLNIGWAPSKIHVQKAYRAEKASRLRRAQNSSIEFASADRIYLNKNTPVRECIQYLFTEELKELDFQKNPEECRIEINNWISDLTKGNIKDILPQGSITSATNMVLANAAYFKGTWLSKFDVEDTKDEPFYVTPEKIRFVKMMNLKGNFYHSINERIGAHVLELPYVGHEVSMYIVLPPTLGKLEDVLKKLSVETLQEALQDGISREVKVSLPKFAFEKQIELRTILEQIGIGEIFTSSANLTAFTGTKLTLDDAIHKSKIIVDEEGSTAASATVLFSFRSSRPLEPAIFNCNHPFFFFIFDSKSNAVLFSGIYRDPEQ